MSNCTECKFFRKEHGLGECHFNPPLAHSSTDRRSFWPLVGQYDWCGKWEKTQEVEDRMKDVYVANFLDILPRG